MICWLFGHKWHNKIIRIMANNDLLRFKFKYTEFNSIWVERKCTCDVCFYAEIIQCIRCKKIKDQL